MTSSEECNSRVALLDGILNPRPPSLAGKANNLHSRSLGGGLPVRAGKRTERSASSSGLNRGPISGMVRLICPLAHQPMCKSCVGSMGLGHGYSCKTLYVGCPLIDF